MKAAIDTVVTVETPEGIAIAIRPAGFPVRGIAFAIDACIRWSVFGVMATALNAGGRMGTGLLLLVYFGINWLYPILFELLPGAATPGKHAMGLRVMMVNGLPITPAGSLIRNLLRAVDMLPAFYGFGVCTMLLRPDARRLGDLAAGTVVVYRNRATEPGAFGTAAPQPPPAPLSRQQRDAVAAFAWRVARLTPERAEEIAQLATASIPEQNGLSEGDRIAAGASMTARLIGIARWLHGERPAARTAGS